MIANLDFATRTTNILQKKIVLNCKLKSLQDIDLFHFLSPFCAVQNEFTDVIDRLNKVENASKVKAKLQSAGLDQGMIDTILEALNDT